MLKQGSGICGVVIFQKMLLRGAVYCEILTPDMGRVKGVMRRPKSTQPACLVGRDVVCENTARMHASLPLLAVTEVCDRFSFLPLLSAPLPLLMWRSALDVCRLAPEQEPCVGLMERLRVVRAAAVEYGRHDVWKSAYIALEMAVLSVMGFGMSVHECAVTKRTEKLRFISPNTGAAVVDDVGRPYAHKLLVYPAIFARMRDSIVHACSDQEFFEALSVVGFFLKKHTQKRLLREHLVVWDASA